MIRTNKTFQKSIVSASAALLLLSVVCFAEEAKPAPDERMNLSFSTNFVDYNPETYKGDTGSIDLPCACDSTLSLWQSESRMQLFLRGTSSKIKLPVGTYRLNYCSVTLPTKNGVTCSIVVVGNSKSETIVVRKDKGTKLSILEQAASKALSTKTGTITLPYNAPSMIALTGVKQKTLSWYINISGESKMLRVPAGKYGFMQCNSSVTGKDGVKWAITSRAASQDDLPTIEVKPNTNLKLGPFEPIIASVEATDVGNGSGRFNLNMTGKDGNLCTIRRAENAELKHGFQVLSKSGEVLMSGKFEFG